MKRVFLTLTIVVTTSIFAQNSYKDLSETDEQNISLLKFDNEKYDKECFLIGMLNEYWGYRIFHGNLQVDFTTTKTELKYLLFIESLFNSDYYDITIANNGSAFRIYSPTLSRKIDDYYIYVATKLLTVEGDTMYSGHLKKEKFETEKQKQSFLLGAYLRYGKNMESFKSYIQWLERENALDKNINCENATKAIALSNASEKASFCKELLTDFDCKDVQYVNSNTFPSMNIIVFTSSEKTQEAISEAERLNRQIETINTNVNFTIDGTKYIWDGK